MVDRWANTIVHPTMEDIAEYVPRQISADTITLFGFAIGMVAVPLLWIKLYSLALIFILINRFFDGLDGAVARRNGITSLGGYLDITCDLIFYSAVIFGFALADPEKNSLSATFLIFSFIGTGVSFLAFAAVAEKHGISSEAHGQKAFYYLEGLAEGTETILFYIIICFFPEYFPGLAVIFASICWLTVIGRFGSAYSLLR
jgi:phosphatidylglycerophosphate synthase